MNDLPIYVWLLIAFVLLSWLVLLMALTHVLIALQRVRDLKEFWYSKYQQESETLRRYRVSLTGNRRAGA